METPRTKAGRLTNHIMAAMPEMDTGQYNAVYIAVLGALNNIDAVGLAIVPENDWAFMARFSVLSEPAKRAIKSMILELELDKTN